MCFIGSVSCSGVHGAESTAKDSTYVPTKNFEMWDDLEVSVWARSPLLSNPTNMDIDAKGRIWVAEGVNYRKQHHPPGVVGSAWRTDGAVSFRSRSAFVERLSDGFPECLGLLQVICAHADIAGFLVHCQVDHLGVGIGGL